MDTVWVSQRASDADRDRAVRRLQDALVDGRLSYDTFMGRLDVALGARDVGALDRALEDLRRRRRPSAPRASVLALMGRVGRMGGVGWRPHRRLVPSIELPTRRRLVVLIGRARDCDLVLTDPDISRRHAALMRYGSTCFVLDRESTNGTWLNGRRVHDPTVARPGDALRLGPLTFELCAPR